MARTRTGVIEQHLVAAHLDVDRSEAGQIGVQGVRQRITGIAAFAQEDAREPAHELRGEEGVPVPIGFVRLPDDLHVHPR
jgi:hypothetical protein